MPFWWRRRRKNWYASWGKRRYYGTRRKRRYQTRRRRYRRPSRRRRRRRRRGKVRRKRQQIVLKQWNPDRIVKCKIIGYDMLVAGADGNQYHCYTNTKKLYTQPRAPGGGGFGCQVFSLEYLYDQWRAHKNIWTKTNDYTDLVRFLGCKLIFYRSPETDFIVSYTRQPPFTFDKNTYPEIHPQLQLLSKHHKVIRCLKYTKSRKSTVTIKIKPTKLMSTKWFFQPEFADAQLFKLQGAAMNLGHSLYGPNTQSPCITIHALNINYYKQHNWADASKAKYLPYPDFPTTSTVKYTDKNGRSVTIKASELDYAKSVAFPTGFFQPGILQAIKVENNSTPYHERPVTLGRYNPEEDTGVGNRVWVTSTFNSKSWQPPSDSDLLIGELPLYICLYGIWDYVQKKKAPDFLKQAMFVIKSDFIKILTPSEQTVWPILDLSFIQGKMPYDETPTQQDLQLWYPTCYKQQQAINDIVESGPYTPKYTNLTNSTWQLPYKYIFYLKWGGSQITDQLIQDPKDQDTYPIPGAVQQTIQITDPRQQSPKEILRSWDFRRSFITRAAFKRMQENLATDESDQSDLPETPPKKKRVTSEIQLQDQETQEIEACLQTLCKKSTFPEDTENLRQLIYQQYQQQQELKDNIFKLLIHLKKKQRALQTQTGLF
nr:MAG: ORF1 [Torque teno midi virus]